MKKILKKSVLLLLMLSMIVCFAACNDDNDKPDGETGIKSSQSSKNKKAEKQIEAYIALQQDDLDEVIDELKEQGVDAKFYAEGSSLVYEYTLGFDVPAEGIAQFEENIKSSEADLKAANEIVFSECSAVEEVVYIYYDIDGTKLCELSFSR